MGWGGETSYHNIPSFLFKKKVTKATERLEGSSYKPFLHFLSFRFGWYVSCTSRVYGIIPPPLFFSRENDVHLGIHISFFFEAAVSLYVIQVVWGGAEHQQGKGKQCVSTMYPVVVLISAKKEVVHRSCLFFFAQERGGCVRHSVCGGKYRFS